MQSFLPLVAKTFAQNLCTIVDEINVIIFQKKKSDFLEVATTRECNFTMGTILGKGLAQALVPNIVTMLKSDIS